MPHSLDSVEFFLSIFFAVLFACLVVFALVQGRLYLGRRVSITYRERPGAFLGWLFLFAVVAVVCAREAFDFTSHLV